MKTGTEIEAMQLQDEKVLDPPEAGKREGKKSPQVLLEGAWPCQHLDFGLLTSRTLRQ